MQGWLLLRAPDWDPPRSVLQATPALPALPPTPAQGSCEYPTHRVSVRALSTSQPAGSPPTGVTSLGFPKGSGQKAGLRDKYLVPLCLVFRASVPGKEDEEANCTEKSFMGF